MIRNPLATLGCRTISPISRRERMIRIERLEIGAHLSNPGATLGPATGQTLGFIYQFKPENRGIVAIHDSVDTVAAHDDLFDVLAIETTRRFVRIKQHRLLVVDAEGILIIVGAANSGPAQVLRHAPRIAPPVREAELDPQAIVRGFSQDLIEKDELTFVPFVRCVTKGMCARPVVKICDWLHVTRPALTKGPHAHNLDADLRRLPQ